MSRSPLDFVRQQGFTESEPIVRQDLDAAWCFNLESSASSCWPASCVIDRRTAPDRAERARIR